MARRHQCKHRPSIGFFQGMCAALVLFCWMVQFFCGGLLPLVDAISVAAEHRKPGRMRGWKAKLDTSPPGMFRHLDRPDIPKSQSATVPQHQNSSNDSLHKLYNMNSIWQYVIFLWFRAGNLEIQYLSLRQLQESSQRQCMYVCISVYYLLFSPNNR